MWIKASAKVAGLTRGTTTEVDDDEGAALVAAGYAVQVDTWEQRLAAEGYVDSGP